MAGLLDALSVSGGALMAQQHGVQVASHNVSNVSTPGYHRQELTLTPQGPATLGVTDAGAHRVIDQILGGRVLAQQAQSGYADTRSQGLAQVEALTGQLDDVGLSTTLDNFFSSWRDLAAAADDPGARTTALARTQDLATRIQGAAQDLTLAQKQADSEIGTHLDEANLAIDQVAQLNGAIAQAEAGGGEASDLRDQRDTQVGKLAELVGATSFAGANGELTVVVNGVSLVQGDAARHLATTPDATTGFAHVIVTGGTTVDLTTRLDSGKVGGLLSLRDQDLAQALGNLDSFAYDLATAVNTAHQAGVGLDGVGGRNLFTQPAAVSGAALGLSVDPSVAGNPDRLGAALTVGSPGDGQNASAISQLDTALVAGGGTKTLAASLSATLAALGSAVQSAGAQASAQADRLTQLQSLQEAQSGVSIEEQMLALDRYQRGFEAASKVVSAVDKMLEDLLAI